MPKVEMPWLRAILDTWLIAAAPWTDLFKEVLATLSMMNLPGEVL
jgi:hypothetical protein